MDKIEILAPAGSMESLYAAINKGADAVYLGGNKFSARAYASNFDNDGMIKAVDYAHYYGVKVYVTLNTLLKEEELNEAIKYVGFLYEIGVDALIIQDLGLFNLIKKGEYHNFEIHASTQMTIHNGEGALYFYDKGFHRLVLSRELSFDEIKYISKDLGLETEIFVHGALCICYSGQCLMSSMIGGRSGNRGRCAQPCRLPYTLRASDGREAKGYLLSPKDICTIEDVKDIIDSGTASLKIEGRMKKPEYVASVVDNYRRAVEKELYNKSYNSEVGKKELLKLFNREGFSKAYFKKNVGKDMMSYNFPKNTGVLLGKVLNNGEVILEEDIALGDGVRQESEKGFTVSKIICNGNEVDSAHRGEKVKLFPITYKKGQVLYRTSDKKQLDELGEFTKAYLRKLPLSCNVIFKIGEPLKLFTKIKGEVYEVEGPIVEEATNRPLTMERVEEAIKKSGDYPYKIENVNFIVFNDGFVRISDLNNLRRDLFEAIMSKVRSNSRRRKSIEPKDVKILKEKINIGNLFTCITKEQFGELLKISGEKNIALDIFTRGKEVLTIKDIKENRNLDNVNLYIKCPNIIKGEFKKVCSIIDELMPYIKGIVTANAGLIKIYKDKLTIIGDYKLNIYNSSSLEFYYEDVNLPSLSLEINKKETIRLMKNTNLKPLVNVYGKVELMVSEYCPIGSTFGGKDSTKECNVACMTGSFTLIDRMKEGFRVITDIFCRSYILNSKPLNLINEISEYKELGIEDFRIDFKDESKEEVRNIVKMLNSEIEIKGDYTKGHYRRGVE